MVALTPLVAASGMLDIDHGGSDTPGVSHWCAEYLWNCVNEYFHQKRNVYIINLCPGNEYIAQTFKQSFPITNSRSEIPKTNQCKFSF